MAQVSCENNAKKAEELLRHMYFEKTGIEPVVDEKPIRVEKLVKELNWHLLIQIWFH